MEKSLRVLSGEDDSHGHSHSHSHSIADSVAEVTAQASGIASPSSANGLRLRGHEKSSDHAPLDKIPGSTSANSSSKLSAYLNLFGDFVHNM
jgi:zinc transporter 7